MIEDTEPPIVNIKTFLTDFRHRILPLLPMERWQEYQKTEKEIQDRVKNPSSTRYYIEWSNCLRALRDYWMNTYQTDIEMHQATANHV